MLNEKRCMFYHLLPRRLIINYVVCHFKNLNFDRIPLSVMLTIVVWKIEMFEKDDLFENEFILENNLAHTSL